MIFKKEKGGDNVKEVWKYILRSVGIGGLVGLVSLIFTGILYGVFFKLLIAIVVAEVIWAFWFKPFFGSMEGQSDTKFLALAIMRGILLGSCVIGACLGL